MEKSGICELAKEFADRVRAVPGVENPRVFLFGSAARDEMENDSDIDVLVILDYLDEKIEGEISRIAFRMGLERGVLFNEVVYTKADFSSPRFMATPFYENLSRDAVPV